MNLLRLFPAVQQFQVKNGALNTDGRLYVYYNGTDDLADVFDVDGSRLAQPVILDNDGRARGLFVDDSRVYRLEVQDRSGALLFTVRNMVPSGGGAGSAMPEYEVVSSDGTVSVDRFDSDGKIVFDLSTDAGKGRSVLKCDAETLSEDGPFVFGQLVTEGEGLSVVDGSIVMEPGWYHFTANVELGWNGPVQNSTAPVQLYTTLEVAKADFDLSYAHSESLELSGDVHCVMPGSVLMLGMSGLVEGMDANIVEMHVHSIVGGTGSDGGYYTPGFGIDIDVNKEISVDTDVIQEKLTAGANVTISNNVISATDTTYVAGENITITGNVISATGGTFEQVQSDWNETDTTDPAFIKNKPDLTSFATESYVDTGLAGKQDTISDLGTIRAGAAAGATALQPGSLAGYATENYVDTGLAAKQDVLTAGSNINIVGDVISATDTTYVAGNGIDITNNVISATGGGGEQVQSDWAETDSAEPSFIQNKPAVKELVAGSNISIVEGTDSVTISAASSTQVQADWAQDDSTAVDFIKNKPDLTSFATETYVDTGLAGKQDSISDLATIRQGAAAGATALQPGALSGYATENYVDTGLAAKQDTISDLAAIRSGAAAGATALQPGALDGYATEGYVDNGLAAKQDTISDLTTIRSGAAAGATALQPGALDGYATENYVDTGLAAKQDVLTAGSNITIDENNVISATGGGFVTLTSSDGSITTANNDLTFTNSRIVDEPQVLTAIGVYRNRNARVNSIQGGEQYWFDWTATDATSFPSGTRIGFARGSSMWWLSNSRILLYMDNTPTGDYIELVYGQQMPAAIEATGMFNSFVWNAGSAQYTDLSDFDGFKLEWTEPVTHYGVYAETDDVNTALAAKQDVLMAGYGIDITNNVISSSVQPATITTDQFAGKTDKVVARGSTSLSVLYTPTEVSERTTIHHGWAPASYVFSNWSPISDITDMASITVPSTVLRAELVLNFDSLEFPWGAPSDGNELVFTVRRNGQELRKLHTVYRSATGAFEEVQYSVDGGATYNLNFLAADQPRLLYSLSLDGTMQISGGYDEEVTETRTVCNVPDYTLDDDDKVTAIDGHEIAGGGGGTEYTGVAPVSVDNDSHEISVDTVPVHYQQITHDDSLVHQSNDTVYALGVNVPYMKWLMGVDETVLWEGNPTSSSTVLTMSETWNNFEKIEIHFHVFERRFIELLDSDSVFQIAKVFSVGNTSTNNTQLSGIRYDANTDKTQFNWVSTSNGYLGGSLTASWNSNIYPTKIVGVHRKTWNGGN